MKKIPSVAEASVYILPVFCVVARMPEGGEAQKKIEIFLIAAVGAVTIIAIIFAIYAYLLRIENNKKSERWIRMESEWKESVLEVLTGDMTVDDMLASIRDEDRMYFVDFIQQFAGKITGGELETLSELARPFLPGIARNVKAKDPDRRARSVRTLSLLGFEEYESAILSALDDKSPLVAMMAARALVNTGKAEYAEALLERYDVFVGWNKNFLAGIIVEIGLEAAPPLRSVYADESKDVKVRAVAADALRKMKDLKAGVTAAAILETETNIDLLAASLRVLMVAGYPEHLPLIRRHLHSDSFVIRSAAAGALGMLGTAEDVERLVSLLDDDSTWVAIRAAESIKDIGGLEALRRIGESEHRRADLAMEILGDVA